MVRRVVAGVVEILVGRARRMLGRAAAIPASGNENCVFQRGHACVLADPPGAGDGAGNHGDDGRLCSGLLFVDEIETVADKRPFVLECPRFLHVERSTRVPNGTVPVFNPTSYVVRESGHECRHGAHK